MVARVWYYILASRYKRNAVVYASMHLKLYLISPHLWSVLKTSLSFLLNSSSAILVRKHEADKKILKVTLHICSNANE